MFPLKFYEIEELTFKVRDEILSRKGKEKNAEAVCHNVLKLDSAKEKE
jgi:hypothetical protein